MRLGTHIKSLNETFLVAIIAAVVIILLSIWFYTTNNNILEDIQYFHPVNENANGYLQLDNKWASYKNGRFGFTVSYPPNWTLGEAPTNDDGRSLYDDGYNKVSVYGKMIDPEYPDDFIEGGQVIFQKPFKLSNGEKGTLFRVDGDDRKIKYIMYIDHKINSELFADGYYKERYVIYASVSNDFLDDHLYTLNRIMESFIPPPN